MLTLLAAIGVTFNSTRYISNVIYNNSISLSDVTAITSCVSIHFKSAKPFVTSLGGKAVSDVTFYSGRVLIDVIESSRAFVT